MRAAAIAAVVIAAFVGVLYLRFTSDSVPEPPSGAAVSGPQCVIFRAVSDSDDAQAPPTCGPEAPENISPAAPVTPKPEIPDTLKAMAIIPLELRPPIDLPPDIALIVETGCWQCDGLPTGLMRAYRDATGTVRTDTLISPEKLGLPAGAMAGFAVREDGSEIVAAACTRGICQHLDGPSPDAQAAVYRSRDGGMTWTHEAMVEQDLRAYGFVQSGEVLMMTYDRVAPPGNAQQRFLSFPSYSPVANPAMGRAFVAGGRIFWRGERGALSDEEGRTIVASASGDWSSDVYTIAGSATGWLANLNIAGFEGSIHRYFLAPFDNLGGLGRGSFGNDGSPVLYEGPSSMWVGVYVPSREVFFGNAEVASPVSGPDGRAPQMSAPAVIDLHSRTITPIVHPFADMKTLPVDGFRVVAVQQGPFARVVNTGSCLNVRREPQLDGRVIDCFSDGVLLRDSSHGLLYADEWVQVVVPGGEVGWANAQYLER
jgi:hypothetical protein